MSIELPFPPSVNRMWRAVRGRNILSKVGREYRAAGLRQLQLHAMLQRPQWPHPGRLSVTLTLCPPDRRRRDVDNFGKAVLDLLTHGEVYHDDSQIDRLLIVRGPVMKGGRVRVEIEAL